MLHVRKQSICVARPHAATDLFWLQRLVLTNVLVVAVGPPESWCGEVTVRYYSVPSSLFLHEKKSAVNYYAFSYSFFL